MSYQDWNPPVEVKTSGGSAVETSSNRGWICPRCSASVSPKQTTCPRCSKSIGEQIEEARIFHPDAGMVHKS